MPFWALFAVGILGPVLLGLGGDWVGGWLERRRFGRAGLQEIRQMHWREFERFLGHLFEALGHTVQLTPPAGDHGVDLVLTDAAGRRTAVQAKHWRRQKVGEPEVQRTIGGARYYRCEHVMVITTSAYTDEARAFARQTGVELWTLRELGAAMERVRSGGGPVAPAARPVNAAAARQAQAARPLGLPVKRRRP
jgi:hypothetical protein